MSDNFSSFLLIIEIADNPIVLVILTILAFVLLVYMIIKRKNHYDPDEILHYTNYYIPVVAIVIFILLFRLFFKYKEYKK